MRGTVSSWFTSGSLKVFAGWPSLEQSAVVMETKDLGPGRSNAVPQPVRWWPAAVILFLFAGALFWVWTRYGINRQERNIATAIAGIVTFALLLIWFLFFSRARTVVRWLAFFGVVAAMALTGSLFRIRGVTGDLVPVLEWRWQKKRLQSVATTRVDPSTRAILSSTHDYPQFLGPERTGILRGPALARDWKARPPEQIWRRAVGPAWSGFAVVGNLAITQEQRGDDEMVVGYDLHTGEPRWAHADKAHYHTTIAGEGPRATPTVVSNRVYAMGATGILNCLELATGQLVWSKDVVQDNHSRTNEWGMSCSPLVVEDAVVVSVGGKNGRSLVAYHKETGALVWAGGNDGAGYSSPVLATLAGARQVLIFNSGGVAAHAVDSGEVLWSYPWTRNHPHVAQPVVLPNDQLLVASGYGTGAELLQIRNGEAWSATKVWKSIRLKPKFANVIYLDGCIYGLDDGVMVCVDAANGELKWKEGRYGHGQVILVGKLLLVMAERGDVVLLEPVPNEHRELTRFTAFHDKTWNPPALAGEYLLVRNDKEAACYRLPLADAR